MIAAPFPRVPRDFAYRWGVRTVLRAAHIFTAGPFSGRCTFPCCPPHS